jgi:TolB protein
MMKRKTVSAAILVAIVILSASAAVGGDLTPQAYLPKVLKNKTCLEDPQIAFVSDRDGNYEIYVMKADGTCQTRLTNDPEDDKYPLWSPDGSKIAFSSDRDGNREIYVMNADGTGQTNLTNDPAWDSQPAWSPDSTKIAFGSERDGLGGDIYVVNIDGTGLTNLTNDLASNDDPTWSPDGTKIAFAGGG